MTKATNTNIKVLIIDDSAVVRKILARELNAKAGIEVVGTAPDPYVAREQIVALNPDVLSLDIEMPRMDGITFLRKLMASRPMPVIVLSSMGEQGGAVALEALEAGAVEVVKKPGEAYTVQQTCDTMATLIRVACNSYHAGRLPTPIRAPIHHAPQPTHAMTRTSNKVIAIGASTGGVQALNQILAELPVTTPGIVVVQHMPPHFTALFAERLNQTCDLRIKEACDGDHVVPGQVLIAPGGRHMTLVRSGATYLVQLNDAPPVCLQRPSVDVLFDSVAKFAGANAIGALLTGMGKDGAVGLKAMRDAGAHTLAQDEASSIVFGMPDAAIKLGAAERIVSLQNMATALLGMAVAE